MIDLGRIERCALSTNPFEWAFVGGLFAEQDASALTSTFPRDHFKTVYGYDVEKGFEYEARELIGMNAGEPSNAGELSAAWRRLAEDLLSHEYRAALSRLTGLDLSDSPLEANVFHYGPGAWLGPHIDLKEKIVTHVFYFNESWDESEGGCLCVLRSAEASDAAASIAPVIGNSVVLVRSEKSWHAVSPVVKGCRRSRLSMTVTFYSPGAVSTMWPPGDATPLHRYDGTDSAAARGASLWGRLRAKVSSVSSRLAS